MFGEIIVSTGRHPGARFRIFVFRIARLNLTRPFGTLQERDHLDRHFARAMMLIEVLGQINQLELAQEQRNETLLALGEANEIVRDSVSRFLVASLPEIGDCLSQGSDPLLDALAFVVGGLQGSFPFRSQVFFPHRASAIHSRSSTCWLWACRGSAAPAAIRALCTSRRSTLAKGLLVFCSSARATKIGR